MHKLILAYEEVNSNLTSYFSLLEGTYAEVSTNRPKEISRSLSIKSKFKNLVKLL